jgi:diketogulonate reductase-like aldo/keto reductase
MRGHRLASEAYSPPGTGRYLADPSIQAIAARNGARPAQVLIGWGLQHGFVVLSKSLHRDYLAENIKAMDLTFSDADMREFDGLVAGSVPGIALELKWW